MPEEPTSPTSNIEIYDRPERQSPSSMMLIIGALAFLAVALLFYYAVRPSESTVTPPRPIRTGSAFTVAPLLPRAVIP